MALTAQIPTSDVKYSNITITSIENRTATITVQTRKANSKTGRWSKPKTIDVRLSNEISKWLFERHHDGKTGFQKFLDKKEIPFKRGILQQLDFISNNLSEDYYENPFKIIEYPNYTQLTLTHRRPMIKNAQGKYVYPEKPFYKRESYRRYVILM